MTNRRRSAPRLAALALLLAALQSHFRNGDTEIILSAPASAGALTLSYRHRRLIEAGEARRGREAKVRGMVDAGEL
jgi:hypothetical protein